MRCLPWLFVCVALMPGAAVYAQAQPEANLYAPYEGLGEDAGKVVFVWDARGDTLPDGPVSLWYAEGAAGPWRLIADRLPAGDCASFAWARPSGVPDTVYLRLAIRVASGPEVRVETEEAIRIRWPHEEVPDQ